MACSSSTPVLANGAVCPETCSWPFHSSDLQQMTRHHLVPWLTRFVFQRTATSRTRQLAAIPFELAIHQDVLHSPGHLIRFGIGCGVNDCRGIEDRHVGVESALEQTPA